MRMSKKISMKKRIGLLALAGILVVTPVATARPVLANEASVTWEKVEQGIDDNNQYVYKKADGTYKTDATMPSGVLKQFNGSKYGYITNGKVLTNSGSIVAPNWSGWWHIVNGWVDTSSGLLNTATAWYVFDSGKQVVTENETLSTNSNGTYYVVDGAVDFNHTGLVAYSGGIAYVVNGKVSNYTGLIEDTAGVIHKGDIFYFENGYFKATDTVAKLSDGVWYKVTNGKVDKYYSGIAENSNGWWYLRNGKVDFNYTNVSSNENGTFFIRNGKYDTSYTGQWNSYYVVNGHVIQ